MASRQDVTLTTVRKWVHSGVVPAWSECVGLSPKLRCWRLQIGNLSVDTRATMAPSGCPVGSFSACCAKSGASGDDLSIS